MPPKKMKVKKGKEYKTIMLRMDKPLKDEIVLTAKEHYFGTTAGFIMAILKAIVDQRITFKDLI